MCSAQLGGKGPVSGEESKEKERKSSIVIDVPKIISLSEEMRWGCWGRDGLSASYGFI